MSTSHTPHRSSHTRMYVNFKHVISQFPRRGQSEGWIARHVILSTALRVLLVSTTNNSTDYHHHKFHLQS